MADSTNPFAADFGKNLRHCRHGARLSQQELGQLASLHRTEISLLERGIREPRLGTIVKLADGLSVALKELLEGLDWQPTTSGGQSTGDPKRPER